MANMAQAIRMALHYGEQNLGVTEILGEDVGPPLGGVFTATQGLDKAWNAPLDERGIIGAALGLAWAGAALSPKFSSSTTSSTSSTCSSSPPTATGRRVDTYKTPMVVMTPTGSGIHGSIYHSHSFDSSLLSCTA